MLTAILVWVGFKVLVAKLRSYSLTPYGIGTRFGSDLERVTFLPAPQIALVQNVLPEDVEMVLTIFTSSFTRLRKIWPAGR